MKNRLLMLLAAFLMVAFTGCKKAADDTNPSSGNNLKANLCTEQCFTLTAGAGNAKSQFPVGNVCVNNDKENFYITFNLNVTGWSFVETHLYLGSTEPTGRLAPGLYNYNSYFTNVSSTQVVYKVPLNDLENFKCGDLVWMLAHAAIQKIVDGVVVSTQTAMAGTIIYPKNASWYGKFSYTVQCCDIPPPDVTCQNYPTGWGGDTKGPQLKGDKGNNAWWYYFDTQGAATQFIYVGPGKVTTATVTYDKTLDQLTINLDNSGWWLHYLYNESVKVQGYSLLTLPTSHPIPGQFTLYKGTNLTAIQGDGSRFYAIHLDLQDCQPPAVVTP